MRVVLTDEAQADLERIADHIANHNPGRAVTFVSELVESCDRLGLMPERFPLVARYSRSGIRQRTHGDYLILYRVSSEQIEVIHILHGAQDVDAILSRAP